MLTNIFVVGGEMTHYAILWLIQIDSERSIIDGIVVRSGLTRFPRLKTNKLEV